MARKVKTRVTNDMINMLSAYELRTVCVYLGLPLVEAFRAKPDARVKWFAEHMDAFVAADLSSLDWSVFRPPAKDYLYALQAYAGGSGVTPILNPLMDVPVTSPVTYVEPDVWARTEEEIAEDEEELDKEEEEMSRFKKAALGSATEVEQPAPAVEAPAPEPVQQPVALIIKPGQLPSLSAASKATNPEEKLAALVTLVDSLAQAITGLSAAINEVKEVAAGTNVQLNDFIARSEMAGAYVDNALLFIINQAFVTEGAEPVRALTELPNQAVAEDDIPM